MSNETRKLIVEMRNDTGADAPDMVFTDTERAWTLDFEFDDIIENRQPKKIMRSVKISFHD